MTRPEYYTMQIVDIALNLKHMYIERRITRDEYEVLIRRLEDQYNHLNPRDDEMI
jgi:hypothetical protein